MTARAVCDRCGRYEAVNWTRVDGVDRFLCADESGCVAHDEVDAKVQVVADDLYSSFSDKDPAVIVIVVVNGELHLSHNIDGGDDAVLSRFLCELGQQLADEVERGERTHAPKETAS